MRNLIKSSNNTCCNFSSNLIPEGNMMILWTANLAILFHSSKRFSWLRYFAHLLHLLFSYSTKVRAHRLHFLFFLLQRNVISVSDPKPYKAVPIGVTARDLSLRIVWAFWLAWWAPAGVWSRPLTCLWGLSAAFKAEGRGAALLW